MFFFSLRGNLCFRPFRPKRTVARTVMCRQDGRGRFPVLLDDHSKCRTNSQRKSQLRILYMVCTLNDIYKQYNKLHEHWYTKISSLRSVAGRNPPQNASDLYTKYWLYAENCRPCTRLSSVNWWKQKQITLTDPIGYSLFADHRSVPSSEPGFVCLTNFCLSRVCAHLFRDNAVTGDIPLISPVLEWMVPP